MEPHCQSVLTPPPPFSDKQWLNSALDALEPLSQFASEGGQVCCPCVEAHAYVPLRVCVWFLLASSAVGEEMERFTH